ncbi:MAG: hypothetical protein LBC23_05870 [Coriobacteriales bacterium]|jgi:hypothetical protein|nr:hypothetical protein [Coriobacteriales bacterium]
MFVLTDETIESAIDNISGFIITKTTERTGKPLEEITRLFYRSKLYAQLSDKNTGYYWDSIPEMIDIFENELNGTAGEADERTGPS